MFEPSTSLDLLYTSGLSGLGITMESVFSFRGLSYMAFFLMVILLMFGNISCKDIIKEQNEVA